jgi:probable F420-dependent oxidoreductase
MIERETLFHGVNLGEHSLYHDKLEGAAPFAPGGKMLWPPHTPWPDFGAAFGAMAAVTKRLHFVTSIMILPHHHPFEVARTFATLSIMSGNRAVLGTGVGWLEVEYKTLGVDYATRGKRYDEALDVLRLLWRGDWAEYHGRHFSFPKAQLGLNPPGHIPIYVGGDSPAAMRRAATKGDGWISGGANPEQTPQDILKIRTMLKEAGRENAPFEIVANLPADLDLIKRARDAGVTSVFNLPVPEAIQGVQTLQQKIDEVRRYSDEIIAKM